MGSGTSYRISGQSKTENSIARKKRTQPKSALMRPACTSKFLLSHESERQDDQIRPLTPADLSLAPFRMENLDNPFLSEDQSGLLATQFVDEDTLKDVEGMPTRAQWKTIIDTYLAGLHSTKRHKSLITQEVYDMIFRTLKAPEVTRVGTPQFRFWARKMFQLVEAPDDSDVMVVTNGGRPVAIKEQIYDILCMCHFECGHGGRDKTCKILREYYTWVPKELISNFVKVCPTCAPRRAVTSRGKERKGMNDAPYARHEETLPGSSRFSVERLRDFSQVPSPLPDNSRQLPPLVQYSSESHHRNAPSLGNSSLSSFDCQLSTGSIPFPPWTATSANVLPPLHNIVQNDKVEHTYSATHDARQLTLPPLMKYLSRSYDGRSEFQQTSEGHFDSQTASTDIPIDPSLLGTPSQSDGDSCTCTTTHCSDCSSITSMQAQNALQLQLHPPTPQNTCNRPPPLSLNLSFVRPSCGEASGGGLVWEFPSVGHAYGREGDNSGFLSVSSVSTGLPTPSSSGQISPAASGYDTSFRFYPHESQMIGSSDGIQNLRDQDSTAYPCSSNDAKANLQSPMVESPPLFSPRPLKVENASAMLELAAAASMDEVKS